MPVQVSNGKMATATKKIEKPNKKSDELKECQEAVVYLLEEMESIKEKMNKIAGRMGL